MKISVILVSVLCALSINFNAEKCTAIDTHTIISSDGNIFAVYDDLQIGKSYTVVFDTRDTESREDDVVISIS